MGNVCQRSTQKQNIPAGLCCLLLLSGRDGGKKHIWFFGGVLNHGDDNV